MTNNPKGQGLASIDDRSSGPASITRSRNGLDELDREIISLLQVNGRMPNTDIARALGVGETTIRNRIARLLAEEFITISAVPTATALGVTVSALIGLGIEPQAIGRVVDRLAQIPEVRFIGVSAGRYDVIVEGSFRDNDALFRFVTETLAMSEGIHQIETHVMLQVEKRAFLRIEPKESDDSTVSSGVDVDPGTRDVGRADMRWKGSRS